MTRAQEQAIKGALSSAERRNSRDVFRAISQKMQHAQLQRYDGRDRSTGRVKLDGPNGQYLGAKTTYTGGVSSRTFTQHAKSGPYSNNDWRSVVQLELGVQDAVLNIPLGAEEDAGGRWIFPQYFFRVGAPGFFNENTFQQFDNFGSIFTFPSTGDPITTFSNDFQTNYAVDDQSFFFGFNVDPVTAPPPFVQWQNNRAQEWGDSTGAGTPLVWYGPLPTDWFSRFVFRAGLIREAGQTDTDGWPTFATNTNTTTRIRFILSETDIGSTTYNLSGLANFGFFWDGGSAISGTYNYEIRAESNGVVVGTPITGPSTPVTLTPSSGTYQSQESISYSIDLPYVNSDTDYDLYFVLNWDFSGVSSTVPLLELQGAVSVSWETLTQSDGTVISPTTPGG